MKTPQSAAFDADVARSLESLGAKPSDTALDGLADPRGAAERLDGCWASTTAASSTSALPIVLRVAMAHEGHDGAYGPDPLEPMWARIERGSREALVVGLQQPVAGEACRERVERIEIEVGTSSCCGAPTCTQDKARASGWMCLEGERGQRKARLLFAEAKDVSAARAREKVECVAARLAKGMGLPLVMQGHAIAAEAIRLPALSACGEHAASPLSAAYIARHVLRTEADRVVLRDHASHGPRAGLWRTAGSGVVLLAIAVGLWVWTFVVAREGRAAVGLGIGAAAMLFSVAAYAFVGVARFAARYGAHSSPLVWIGSDRVVVAPWVNRRGGIDLRPEGRLGAAIRLGEVRGISIARRDGRAAVELDTEHGTIDAVSTDREDVAAFWCSALKRAIDEARHVTKVPQADSERLEARP